MKPAVLIDPRTESVVLSAPDPLMLRELLPRSRTLPLPDWNFAVQHTLESTKVLRNLGFKVPAPIATQYQWPGRFKPYAHQIEMADFLTMHRRCFNLSEMGTMKTNASLWSADWLMRTGRVRKALIMSPLSTLESVWANDIFDTLPHRTCAVLHGTQERRLKYLGIESDFYILNHDGIKIAKLFDAILKRPDIDLLCIDEAGMFRNPQSGKYKALAKLLKARPDLRLWLMTGTPCPNAPTDAWALAKLVDPARVPQYVGAFKRETMMQVSNFKWVPRIDAFEKAYNAMQPAIRFKKKDCISLPPVTTRDLGAGLTRAQAEAVKQLREHMVTKASNGVKVTAANAADQINKIRQVLCVAENTDVLTACGWKAIQLVTADDLVWDGVEWVSQGGAMLNGRRDVTTCHGVRMTPDHEVLTVSGWRQAQEIVDGDACPGFDRAPVRLPDGVGAQWLVSRTTEESCMALPLRLRQQDNTPEPEPAVVEAAEREALRVPIAADQPQALDVTHKALPHLVGSEATVHQPTIEGLAELRRKRCGHAPTMGGELRGVLAVSAEGLSGASDPWSDRQQQGVRAGEHPLGDRDGTGQQHTLQSVGGHAERADDSDASSDCLRYVSAKAELPAEAVAASRGPDQALTYDLINCGPRQRFVVRGDDGQALIVHNCGALKDPMTGAYHPLPHEPRTQALIETIQQASAKVLVVVPFKGIIRLLEQELVARKITCAVVNGDVPMAKRTEIFKAFKTQKDPHVLLCHPAVMAHGLNLTEADMLIFYAPIYSNDEVEQVNERFNRAGQTRKMTIVRIGCHPLEWAIYRLTDTRKEAQNSILDLYDSVMGS